MKIRIIKSEDCPICKIYLPMLLKQGVSYLELNADAPAIQKQLDDWKIDDLPVVQIVSDDEAIVLYQFPPGPYSARSIKFQMGRLPAK